MPQGTVHCKHCDVSYDHHHYHCCLCKRVFRSVSAFEVHQQAKEPASDMMLLHLKLVKVDGVWRGQPMTEAAKLAFAKLAAQPSATAPTVAPYRGKFAPSVTPGARTDNTAREKVS